MSCIWSEKQPVKPTLLLIFAGGKSGNSSCNSLHESQDGAARQILTSPFKQYKIYTFNIHLQRHFKQTCHMTDCFYGCEAIWVFVFVFLTTMDSSPRRSHRGETEVIDTYYLDSLNPLRFPQRRRHGSDWDWIISTRQTLWSPLLTIIIAIIISSSGGGGPASQRATAELTHNAHLAVTQQPAPRHVRRTEWILTSVAACRRCGNSQRGWANPGRPRRSGRACRRLWRPPWTLWWVKLATLRSLFFFELTWKM